MDSPITGHLFICVELIHIASRCLAYCSSLKYLFVCVALHAARFFDVNVRHSKKGS